jgi:hypothetical protein
MRIILLIVLSAGAFGLTAITPAAAFAPGPGALAATYNASAAAADKAMPLVTVKWKKRPPGWSRGRKVGWRGRDVPPGQLKKRRF